jgi:large subunit ribosomal protein L20
MARVKRGVTAHARHKKVLDLAKGYYGARSKVYRVAKQAVIKAGQYAYRDRRQKKRVFRACGLPASMRAPMKAVCPTAG